MLPIWSSRAGKRSGTFLDGAQLSAPGTRHPGPAPGTPAPPLSSRGPWAMPSSPVPAALSFPGAHFSDPGDPDLRLRSLQEGFNRLAREGTPSPVPRSHMATIRELVKETESIWSWRTFSSKGACFPSTDL